MKRSKSKCLSPYCRKDHAPNRRFCWCCVKKKWKENHPLEYEYNVWRMNCRRRGKPNDVSIEEFKKFCKETDYMELKGRNGNCASIDRKRSWEGYYYDNLQILSVANNTAKQRAEEKGCPF